MSTAAIQNVIEKLRYCKNRDSTKLNYFKIWRQFNAFYLRLDVKPNSWEDWLTLFVGYLINNNKKSSTVKSYISAIKSVLRDVDVVISNDSFLLSALTTVCCICNNHVRVKLPIKKGLLNILINSIDKFFKGNPQPYLAIMYKALFSTMYFGLFRIGELTQSTHVVTAVNVHIGLNKNKMLFILNSSKTHGRDVSPQLIKISGHQYIHQSSETRPSFHKRLDNCPFKLLQNYTQIQKLYRDESEQFFVFHDRSPVMQGHFRNMLWNLLDYNRIDYRLYSSHCFRAGRAVNLLEMGVSV